MESMDAATLATLNKLIDICKDSQHGYRVCAEVINDNEHKPLFEKLAGQRETFLKQLQHETTKYAADDEPKENLSQSFDGWGNLKRIVEQPDAQTIFQICEAEEDKIMHQYGEAIKLDIPGVTKDLITEQYNQIRDSHMEVKLLRDRILNS